MIVQTLTAIALSIVFILMTWAAFRTLKKPMPGSAVPLIIGATVILYGIYSEYTWKSRTLAAMPASVELVNSFSGTTAFSPWSYLVPRVDRMSLADTASIRRNPGFPDYVMLDLLLMQRFNPVARARQLVDCRTGKRADLSMDPEFDAEGLPVNLDWEELDAGHQLVEIACR